MTWSLGALMNADKVRALVREANNYKGQPDVVLGLTEDEAVCIISAVLWYSGVRADSTSAAYAWAALAGSLGLARCTNLMKQCEFDEKYRNKQLTNNLK